MQHARLPCLSPSPVAQIRVHWVGDVIQPSHPLPSISPPTSNLSQYQGLFQWVGSSNQVAKVLELQLQHQSFQWIFRVDFLSDWLDFISLLSQGLFKESCPAPWFEGISSSVLRICMQCGRPGFDTWIGKIPWRRERLPTPVFWPGEFYSMNYIGHRVAKSRTQLSSFPLTFNE